MCPAPIRSQPYKDSVQRSRRQRLWLRKGVFVGTGLALTVFAVWVLFFSSLFAVTDVHVTGVQTLRDDQVAESVRGRNILFLDVHSIARELLANYAVIGSAVITKQFRHTASVEVSEREAIGQWCSSDSCQFFDRTGIRWGTALPSTGPLLISVKDYRTEPSADTKMFAGMMMAVDGLPELGMSARILTLPNAEPGSIVVTTDKKYDIYIDALGDVADQLSVLGVFLSDQAKKASFAPLYIDLRTPGRVYYK